MGNSTVIGTKTIETFRQWDAYSCGPVCVKMVLHHFNIDADVSTLRDEMGTRRSPFLFVGSHGSGTPPEALLKALERRGLYARWQRFTLPLLQVRLRQGNLVIVLVDVTPDRSGGHYVVVHGVDDHSVYISDPLPLPGARRRTRQHRGELAARAYSHAIVVGAPR